MHITVQISIDDTLTLQENKDNHDDNDVSV